MSASEKKALTDRIKELEEKLRKADREIERLRKQLEQALRSLKRQAAPFSKNQPKADRGITMRHKVRGPFRRASTRRTRRRCPADVSIAVGRSRIKTPSRRNPFQNVPGTPQQTADFPMTIAATEPPELSMSH